MHVGPYEVLGELGSGATGLLLRARDPALERAVALKLLADLPAARLERATRRLITEARAASRVRHPNVVAVHGAALHDGRPFLVMDLVEGETLEARIRREGPLPARLAAHIAAGLARGLAAVHAAGVIHRDVKPENVVLDRDGLPVLVDFGLARVEDGRSRITRTGEVLGTFHTISPEQVEGTPEQVGPPCDVYGLGATLFVMLEGRPPFEGDSAVELLRRVLHEEPALPRCDPALGELVLRCLSKRPEERPDAAGLAASLERWAAGRPIARRPQMTWWVLLGAAGLALLVLLLGLLYRNQRSRTTHLRAELSQVALLRSELSAPLDIGSMTLDEVERALAERPSSALHQRRAVHLFQARRYAETRAALDAALELDPESVPARLSRAFLAHIGDDDARLISDAREVTRLQPDESRGWFWQGAWAVGQLNPAEGIPDLERAVALAPDLAPAWTYLGQARAMVGRLDEARAALDRALELEPELFEAWAVRAQLRLEEGDTAGARADVDRGLALAPRSGRALFVSATVALHGEGDPARCLRDLERAFACGWPMEFTALLTRGEAHRALGNHVEARRDLAVALQVCPPGEAYEEQRRQLLDLLGQAGR